MGFLWLGIVLILLAFTVGSELAAIKEVLREIAKELRRRNESDL
jgi:heme exporter protein D